MRARSVELGLLVLATFITCVGYAFVLFSAQVEAGTLDNDALQGSVLAFLGMVVALLMGAHVVIRMVVPLADGLLFPLAALLNGLGFIMISRLDPGLADSQSAWTFVGLCAFTVVLLVITDPRKLEAYRYSLAVLGVTLLLLPLIPGLGAEVNGARIWLRFAGFSIQPGEFAKIVLAMFLAGYLVEKRELLTLTGRRYGPIHVPDLRHFGPLLAALGIALMVMVLQRDLGSSLLFFTLFVVLIYIATNRVAYVLIGLAGFSVGAYIAWNLFAHVQRRVDIWLNPMDDPKGASFQIVEAAFAMADGGITGTGLGQGTPSKIPYAATDMIFAAFGEELGLLGATAILVTYLFFVGAGFRVATNARSPFEKLLAAGLTSLLGFQAFIIIGGILRVLPLTGVTLPFVSYGGSSLISNYVILALLVRISHNSIEQAARELEKIESGGASVSVDRQTMAGWRPA